MRYELIATATFGLEAVVRREIESLDYKVLKTEDGKVTFEGDERAIVRSNLWLRTADRVLLKMAEFEAKTFEELFQQTKALMWEALYRRMESSQLQELRLSLSFIAFLRVRESVRKQ